MADIKISQLPAATTPLAGTEEVPLTQGGTTKKVSVTNLRGTSSGVTAVTGTAPVVSSGGTTPAISMAAATTSVNGYLTSTDWNTFNGKYSTGGALGTPSSGTATNLTGLPLSTGVTGTLPVANGGTAATTAAGARTNILPSYSGNAGKVLAVNSGASDTEWISASGVGTVTSVATGTGLTGGPITASGTIALANTAVTAGSYTAANITVDAQGRITAAANGSGGGGGTVTSVAATVPSFLSVTGSPITTSGTLAISYSGTALPVANGGTGGTTSTGSGAVVLATSPTLVTPLLGTPTSGNFSTGTFTWPTFNQNTTGSAGSVANALTAGTGISFSSGTTYNGSAAITINNAGVTAYPGTGIPNSTGSAWGTSYSTTGSGTVVALATSPSFTTPVLGTPTSGTLSNCTVDGTNKVGYLNLPQNAQTGSYTLVLADAGKHIYHASGAGAATYTIPANSSVAYDIGTAVTFVNLSTTSISIAITTDTMYLSSAGTTGTRTLAQYGSATALKITSTSWIISGSGLT